jgi:hypothetical protein
LRSNRRGRTLAEVMSPIEDDPVSSEAEPRVEMPRPAVGRGGDVPSQSVVPVNVLVAPEDRRRLRQLSLDTNLSLQKLGHEAWNLLLEKRGLPPLKAVSANVPSGRSAQARSQP